MGDAHLHLGEGDQALKAYREASEYYHAAGARAGRTHTLIAMGNVYRQQQAYDKAWQEYEQALEEFRKLRDVKSEADTLVAMAVVQSLQQHSDEALKLFDEAETLYRQASDRSGEARARRFKGEEYLLEKKPELALTEFEEAVKVYQGYGGYSSELEELQGRLGHTLTMLGRKDEALKSYESAIEARSRVESGWHGYRALIEGQFDAADAHFAVVTKRDPDNVQWQIGWALAKFGLAADQTEAVQRTALVKDAAQIVKEKIQTANVADRAEACRWRDYVMGLRPVLREHWGELGLQCEG
jgi:tetratricopeptide (TPR) repeat protein